MLNTIFDITGAKKNYFFKLTLLIALIAFLPSSFVFGHSHQALLNDNLTANVVIG